MMEEAMMMIEILFILFIPGIVINSLCWVMINQGIKKKDKKLRADLVELLLEHEKCLKEKWKFDMDELATKVYLKD